MKSGIIVTFLVMTNLPEVSSSKINFKSVLYNYWMAIVNKKIATGHAIYSIRGFSVVLILEILDFVSSIKYNYLYRYQNLYLPHDYLKLQMQGKRLVIFAVKYAGESVYVRFSVVLVLRTEMERENFVSSRRYNYLHRCFEVCNFSEDTSGSSGGRDFSDHYRSLRLIA